MGNDKDIRNAAQAVQAVADLLRVRAGLPFCSVCLAHETGIAHDQAIRAMETLRPPRFLRLAGLCARCLRRTLVISARVAPGKGTTEGSGKSG